MLGHHAAAGDVEIAGLRLQQGSAAGREAGAGDLADAALGVAGVVEGAERGEVVAVVDGEAAAPAAAALVFGIGREAQNNPVYGGPEGVAFGRKFGALAADAALGGGDGELFAGTGGSDHGFAAADVLAEAAAAAAAGNGDGGDSGLGGLV